MDIRLPNGHLPGLDQLPPAMVNYSMVGSQDMDMSMIAAAGGDITMMNGTAPNMTLATTTLTQVGLVPPPNCRQTFG